MQLELNDVLDIITRVNTKMNDWTIQAAEGEDESVHRGAVEFIALTNMYTASICKAIVKAEEERVENMLKDMEADE